MQQNVCIPLEDFWHLLTESKAGVQNISVWCLKTNQIRKNLKIQRTWFCTVEKDLLTEYISWLIWKGLFFKTIHTCAYISLYYFGFIYLVSILPITKIFSLYRHPNKCLINLSDQHIPTLFINTVDKETRENFLIFVLCNRSYSLSYSVLLIK